MTRRSRSAGLFLGVGVVAADPPATVWPQHLLWIGRSARPPETSVWPYVLVHARHLRSVVREVCDDLAACADWVVALRRAGMTLSYDARPKVAALNLEPELGVVERRSELAEGHESLFGRKVCHAY